ncbi:MAG: cobalt ECF transporter T component CbiQ [Coleofasciculus sp. C1-SOL-03]|uniref:cobalt ECF transporter T component CbiQ n=1 Tax=Coleofasciculus sp. C1-SOL-03 TaxID=3069522 RepID=UPI0032F147B3
MTLEIDAIAYRNRLRHLPPVQKLGFALVVLFISIFSHAPTQFLIILWMGIWTVGYAGIRWRVYLRLIALASLFLLLGLPALIVNIAPTTQIEFAQTDQWGGINLGSWYLYISRSGSQQAGVVFMRSLACMSCLFFILCTVPFIEIVQTMRRLNVPVILTDILLLMYRFVFILLKTAKELKLAQQARNGYRTWRLTMHSLGLLVGQLFLRTLQRYHQFSLGLATRGFTGDFPVGLLHHYRYSKRYAVEAVLGCGGLVGVELVSCHSSFVFRLMSYVICCLFPVLGSFDSAEMYN